MNGKRAMEMNRFLDKQANDEYEQAQAAFDEAEVEHDRLTYDGAMNTNRVALLGMGGGFLAGLGGGAAMARVRPTKPYEILSAGAMGMVGGSMAGHVAQLHHNRQDKRYVEEVMNPARARLEAALDKQAFTDFRESMEKISAYYQ